MSPEKKKHKTQLHAQWSDLVTHAQTQACTTKHRCSHTLCGNELHWIGHIICDSHWVSLPAAYTEHKALKRLALNQHEIKRAHLINVASVSLPVTVLTLYPSKCLSDGPGHAVVTVVVHHNAPFTCVRSRELHCESVMAEWRATVSETKLNLTVPLLRVETQGQTQAQVLMYELGTFLFDLE